jgi:hypothetical protein
MNREKQIEEMAKDLCHAPTCEIRKNGGTCYKYCKAYIYAFRAVNEGYRKVPEVAREIIDILKSAGIDEWRYPVIAELKKKYTESEKNNG